MCYFGKSTSPAHAADEDALVVMSHPGIALLLDAGTTEEGRPNFVMELVKGLPFTEYCDSRQLPLRDRPPGLNYKLDQTKQAGQGRRSMPPPSSRR